MIELHLALGPETGTDSWFVDRLLPPLITGVVTAFVATLIITRANERYKNKREYLLRNVDALRTQLQELVEASTKYWDSPSAELEPLIEYLLNDIEGLVRSCAPDLWADSRSEGPVLVAKLFVLGASENFGTRSNQADAKRALKIAMVAATLADAATAERRRYLVGKMRWPWNNAKGPTYRS